MCDHISADVEALQPLHGANEGGDGGDVVASHIEGLQTRKECYLYREGRGSVVPVWHNSQVIPLHFDHFH